mmetsp:Transcript_3695/g.8098  ORF Transcript_3695/g.8098 Transcript_3695/m.8098 type:complete len:81 (+) Transcript_3695:2435-2677(+)
MPHQLLATLHQESEEILRHMAGKGPGCLQLHCLCGLCRPNMTSPSSQRKVVATTCLGYQLTESGKSGPAARPASTIYMRF